MRVVSPRAPPPPPSRSRVRGCANLFTCPVRPGDQESHHLLLEVEVTENAGVYNITQRSFFCPVGRTSVKALTEISRWRARTRRPKDVRGNTAFLHVMVAGDGLHLDPKWRVSSGWEPLRGREEQNEFPAASVFLTKTRETLITKPAKLTG